MTLPNQIAVTFFKDYAARSKAEDALAPDELARRIAEMVASEKTRLPWLKLAQFGTKRTEKNSLRHDENVLAISGIEGDYDGGKIGFDEAVEIAEKADLACIIYTSPSHTADKPRWRVLCPTSCELPPSDRAVMMARLNGLYRGVFADESFTLSQSYYYGHLAGSRDHRVEVIDGTCIDLLDELDEIAIGKPASAGNGHDQNSSGRVDEYGLSQDIISGKSYHRSAVRLVGLWAMANVPLLEAKRRLEALFDGVFPGDRDERWRQRRADIPRTLQYVYGRQAGKEDEAEQHAGAAAWDEPEQPPAPAWPELHPDALYGLAGEVVRAIEPHSEADPVAILVQYLAAVGNAIGRVAYYVVEGDSHSGNLFPVLVGDSAKGRKGTSWGRVRGIMEVADPTWAATRVLSGLSSGEGLIWAVRDPIIGYEKQGKGAAAERVPVETDPGVNDKRLLVLEPEFARVITVMRREGNTLSAVLRDAWDRGALAALTKNSPARATGAHISIIGHVTTDELRAVLDKVAMANGSANRVLWMMVRRSKVLPFGGNLNPKVIEDLGRRTGAMIAVSVTAGRVDFTAEARELWAQVYPELSAGRAGLLGAITNRAEAQVIRLALIYALLDNAGAIAAPHLRAALAVWRYSETSCEYIWRDAVGNPVADEILRVLRRAGRAGQTRTEIRDLFARHRSAEEIGAALALLSAEGKATCATRSGPSGGRPAEVWTATPCG